MAVSPFASEPRDGSRIRVLVVDDSPVDRRITSSILAKRPEIDSVFASDGQEALALILADPPDVVFTDLQMPRTDGLSLVQAVREARPNLPVVLLTAHGSEEIAIQALHAGAANYLPKRNLVRELLATLDRVLSVRSGEDRRRRLLSRLVERESSFRIENDPELIGPLSNLLLEELDLAGPSEETTRLRVGVALSEALANALFHGNLEVSSDLRQNDDDAFHRLADERRRALPYRDRFIHVRVRIDPTAVRYAIRDEGPGFDVRRTIESEPALTRIGGRGLLLIRTFMDEVQHNAAGNEIVLVKRREKAHTTGSSR